MLRKQARLFPVLAAALWGVLLAAPASAAERKVAIFDFELIDSSLEGQMMGQNPGEQARLARMAPMLGEDMKDEANLALVDIAPVRSKAQSQNLQSCGNCAVTLAREIGADIAVTGTVQKVSNLILNINAYAFDVKSGKALARGSADIRSNTEESWNRGLHYLWHNTLKKQIEAVR